jgi:hypothetical protein
MRDSFAVFQAAHQMVDRKGVLKRAVANVKARPFALAGTAHEFMIELQPAERMPANAAHRSIARQVRFTCGA